MKYNGFYVKISPDTDLHREDKDGNDICCKGFTIEVFADESEKLEIDVFSAAVDFELLKDSVYTLRDDEVPLDELFKFLNKL